MGNTAYLTLKTSFSALHELSNPKLTDDENKKIFGKCFRTHGHDYALEATVKGEIDPKSGLSCDRDYFQDILTKEIREKFHGTHLNQFFKSTTGEVLSREFYNILSIKLKPLQLVSVRLQETPKNFFSFSEDSGKVFA